MPLGADDPTRYQSPDAAPLIGLLGRYELLRELGRGGMGVVYEARDPRLGRRLAIKRLALDDVDPEHVERLRREAQLAAKLSHPGIVAVHEVAAEPGAPDRPYLVMEYIDGGTLDDRVAELDRAQRIDVLIDVARAVGHAHQQGIVHRDLKPDNVLLAREGRVVVSDFGLARPLTVATRLTATGATLGTLPYMAPEQLRGETETVSATADVWSLGAMLFELLTDRRPFPDGTLGSTLEAIEQTAPPSPRRHAAGIPRSLDTICRRALAPTATARYPDATAFADDLARWRAGQPVQTAAPSTLTGLATWAGRRPAQTLLGLAALLLAVVGLSLLVARQRRATAFASERDRAHEAHRAGRTADALAAARRALALRADPTLSRDVAGWERALAAQRLVVAGQQAAAAATRSLALRLRPVEAQVRALQHAAYVPDVDPAPQLAALRTRLAELEPLTASAGDDPRLWAVLGRGWFLTGQTRRAEPALARAIALAPDDAGLHATLGRAVLRRAWGLRLSMRAGAHRRRVVEPLMAEALGHIERSDARWSRSQQTLEAHIVRAYRAVAADDMKALLARCRRGLAEFGKQPGTEVFCHLQAWLDLDEPTRLTTLDAALERRPHDAWLLVLRAGTRRQLGRHGAAIADYDRALQLDPLMVWAHHGRAATRWILGRRADARKGVERALALDPTFFPARATRGQYRIAMGQPEGIDDLRQAAREAPFAAINHAMLGSALATRGDSQGALVSYRRALELLPRYWVVHKNMAQLLRRQGQLDAARAALDRAHAIAPRNVGVLLDRAVLRAGRGDGLGALRDLDRAVAIAPRNVVARIHRGRLRRRSKDLPGALEDLDLAVRLAPRAAEPLVNRALVYRDQRRYREALTDLERALVLRSDFAGAWTARASVHRRLKQYPEAIADLRRALQLTPKAPRTWTELGGVLADAGDRPGAVEALRKALALTKDPARRRQLEAWLRGLGG